MSSRLRNERARQAHRHALVASAAGTTFQSKLKRTVTVEGAAPVDCDYDVMAVAPAIPCASDEDCLATPDPDAGRPTGSGINPDFNIHCDTTIKFCAPPDDAPFPPLVTK